MQPIPLPVAPSKPPVNASLRRLEIGLASPAERELIYRMRHEVYAREIGQHAVHPSGRLTDSLDAGNIYIAARSGGILAGFISITPPGIGTYSVDKYFDRSGLPVPADAGLYEVRLLTVPKSRRGTRLSALLMYAAFRWVESRGGSNIIAIGRREVLPLYRRAGLIDSGRTVLSGAVHYHLMHAPVSELRRTVDSGRWPLGRIERGIRWSLGIPLHKPAACFHGGAFFNAIGPRFDRLHTVPGVINADVLDAWFPPAPGVLESIRTHLPWLLRTSPPTGCEGLIETIAETRGLRPENLLTGAGSSDLIFRAFPRWLNRNSRVLILDPTYGEYAHVLEKVIGCRVERLPLRHEHHYDVPLAALEKALAEPYDLVVLVNPNSPTGRHIPAGILAGLLRAANPVSRIWIDETYVDFAGPGQSMEILAAGSGNLIVCKSMSKAYALSGARVAYLCAGPHQLEELRSLTPPWAVSLVAQLAAVRALESTDYYSARWRETAALRGELSAGLEGLGWQVTPGTANFLLCQLPEDGPDAGEIVSRSRESGLFLRNAAPMGQSMGPRTIRIAVKDADTNQHMIHLLGAITAVPAGNPIEAPQPGGTLYPRI